MINCPSCRMSNLGGTVCTYCKAPLPEDDDAQAYASITEYATVTSKMVEQVGVEAISRAGVAVAEAPPAPKPAPEKKSTQELERLKVREEREAFERRRAESKKAKRTQPERSSEPYRPEEEARPLPPVRRKGPFVGPAILSAVMPGLGQMAKGMTERGFLLLAAIQIAGIFSWTWVVYLIWGYAVYDAYNVGEDSIGDPIRNYFRKNFS